VIRRTSSYALVIAAALIFAMTVKMRATMSLETAGLCWGIGVALLALALIVRLGFPDTRGRGL
jgi:hypothetical protein